MGIYIKGDFKNPYPNCDECIFGELIRCEAISRREVFDYEVDCPLSEIEVNEDCITDIETRYVPILAPADDCISREYLKSFEYINKGDFNSIETIREWIDNAPSVLPKPKEGKRSRCIWCDSPYRIEYNWIDREGNTASFADEDRHLVATGIANYCPNCGKKMKGTAK